MGRELEIRHELRAGDLGELVAFNAGTIGREYGVDQRHEALIASSVAEAGKRGFPGEREDVWIVEREGELCGSIALTEESDTGVVRWFAIDPSLRGRGLGRRLLGELIERARGLGYARLRLEAFSLLGAATHLYREFGFALVDEDTAPRWGHDAIDYQYYELDLGSAEPAGASRIR